MINHLHLQSYSGHGPPSKLDSFQFQVFSFGLSASTAKLWPRRNHLGLSNVPQEILGSFEESSVVVQDSENSQVKVRIGGAWFFKCI